MPVNPYLAQDYTNYSQTLLSVLSQLYSEPTAPFNEYRVQRKIIEILMGFPFYRDPEGFMWLNISGPEQIKHITKLYVSHTDHPGIVFSDKYPNIGTWVGGGPENLLGHKVKVFDEKNCMMSEITYHKDNIVKVSDRFVTPMINTGLPLLPPMPGEPQLFKPKAASLWFDEAPYGWLLEESKIKTIAADDLILVACLLTAIKRGFMGGYSYGSSMVAESVSSSTAVLFTRAEELELKGISSLLKRINLNKNTFVTVLDTSFEDKKQGVLVGKGIGIRTGDLSEQYDKNAIDTLRSLLSNTKTFEYKSDKGRTEASAFIKAGYKNVGSLSVAVKNQHNKTKDGKTPSLETVSVLDLLDLINFLIKNG